ncbi:helix-turn-helix domain-containing protein [uncultured Chryseobacterium sp.]|uniref:helix-turn-helix domain-containing protein n=1 Tax=uncultured Chryseobacterium sp. TaxID=259322 RepID=UPI00374A7A09
MEKLKPDYKKIYLDIIEKKFPNKKSDCSYFFRKKIISALDVIQLNQKIFNSNNSLEVNENQLHKSYDKETVFEILNYQKKNKLNNTQLAHHFNLSRNTITKWKKTFVI